MVDGSFAVEVAYQFLLRGLVDRALGAGEVIDVAAIGSRLGVPVGSVREAAGRLVTLGLAGIAGDGTAGLVDFTLAEAVDEARVWAVLHGVLVADVWAVLPSHLPVLAAVRDRRAAYVQARQDDRAGVAVFEFFAHLRALTTRPGIRVGAEISAYRLVLASSYLPRTTIPALANVLLDAIIDAINVNDLDAAQDALTGWATSTPEWPTR